MYDKSPLLRGCEGMCLITPDFMPHLALKRDCVCVCVCPHKDRNRRMCASSYVHMYKCYVGGCWWVVVIWRFECTASRWRADVEWAERDVTRQRKAARSGGIWKGQEKGQHLLLQPVDKLLQPVDLCHPLAVFVINSWPRHTDQGFDVKIVYNTGIKKGWGKHTYHKTNAELGL